MPAKEVHELVFERSDGDETVWPSNTKKLVDTDGHVNYMQPIGINDEWGVRWRKSIGSALAVHLNLPDGPEYILKCWPEGYHMFVHHKGPQSNPRTDKYIFGSKTVSRFRSIPEFVPHALWLMKDPTLNRENCHCKYCSKTPQKNITESFGLSSQGTTGAFGTSRHSVLRPTKRERQPREKLEIITRPYAAVRREPKPVKLTGPKQFVAKERNSDLRATASRLKRWYREGELLWCSIKPIRPAGRSENSNILYWPGIVEECVLKIPLPVDNDVQMGDSTGAEKSQSTSSLTSDKPAWKIKQWGFYRVSLLALKSTYRIPDYEVLPYQAYGPNPDLLKALKSELAVSEAPLSPSPSAHFFEHPSEYDEKSGARFKVAAAPFSLAIQIAASLALYWTATDDWEFKFSIPPAISLATPPDQSLPTAISSSMSNNHNESISAPARGATGPISNMSRDRLQSVSDRLLSSQPASTSVSQSFTQKRYQGLWWGAERIWTDELVRLKVARKQIAPDGADQIFPPAGPTKSALDAAANVGDATGIELGAGERGVFMKLESLFVVDVPQEDSSRASELRASGMLYELVDADWEGVGVEEPPKEDKTYVINGVGESSTFNSSNLDPALQNETTKLGSQLLPNPDPTVPITETTSDMVSKTLPNRAPATKTRSPNSQLSNPGMNFPLPAPPNGFKFRAILPHGYEAVVSLPLISGRYYPGLLRNPLMRPVIEKAFGPPLDAAKLASNNHIWALEGLCPGYHNSVDPSMWRKSRQEMVKAADQDARGIIENYFRQKDIEPSTGDEDVEMMSVENMI